MDFDLIKCMFFSARDFNPQVLVTASLILSSSISDHISAAFTGKGNHAWCLQQNTLTLQARTFISLTAIYLCTDSFCTCHGTLHKYFHHFPPRQYSGAWCKMTKDNILNGRGVIHTALEPKNWVCTYCTCCRCSVFFTRYGPVPWFCTILANLNSRS